MQKLRINEAVLAFNSKNEGGISLLHLAKKIWPESETKTQQVSISKLVNGKTRRIEMDWVKIICEETGVSPDFLFGYSNGKFDW